MQELVKLNFFKSKLVFIIAQSLNSLNLINYFIYNF